MWKKNLQQVFVNFKTNTYFGHLDAINFATRVKDAANDLVKEQKDRFSDKAINLHTTIKENRSRISAKATNFSVQKWQEAETAYDQMSDPAYVGFSYEECKDKIQRLTNINKLYLDSETSAQNVINESISGAESRGKIFGGIWGGIVGSLVGVVIAAIATGIIGVFTIKPYGGHTLENFGNLFSAFAIFGLVVGCGIGAFTCGSTWGKNWRKNREEKIRRKTDK